MGANLYGSTEGAVLEVNVADVPAISRVRLYDAWATEARRQLGMLRWPTEQMCIVPDNAPGATTVSLFVPAPVDGLMTATEIAEQSWVIAERSHLIEGYVYGDPTLAAKLSAQFEQERAMRPHLAEVYRLARTRGNTIAFDDERVSIGTGAGALVWPMAALPAPVDIAWEAVREVPVTLVTGSNGKTTTTRLVAAMWRAAGKATGWCCSDGVWVDDAQLDSGDYSGPAGARVVLQDDRVEAAVLETARGGMLRRGLATQRASAGIITNIAADHFGEYGVHTLYDLARVKLIIRHALIDHEGTLVLNADDTTLVEVAPSVGARLAWFSTRAEFDGLARHAEFGGLAAVVRDERITMCIDGRWHDLGAIADMPLALGGAAPHNVSNLVGASVVAYASGVPLDAIRHTLAHFGESPSDNPGRLQLSRFGGVTALVDYAHNPDGLAALCETANKLPARRRLLLLGQAGNRDDTQLRALVDAAVDATTFDRVIIKEMPQMLRGRALGEMPAVFVDALRQRGVSAERVSVSPDEFSAVREAFAWARDGDVLVCPVHVEKARVLAWLARLREVAWVPGQPLPEEPLR